MSSWSQDEPGFASEELGHSFGCQQLHEGCDRESTTNERTRGGEQVRPWFDLLDASHEEGRKIIHDEDTR
eukprot:CAMPEP_0194781462 /NCGR_PEP_ID=MMETSP0323_2-20130528/76348_1 /TAXON_ID=2866 ORGANISM="Crypthecodinium cohnii, Strain Seligo" /NCGR_SAMPLE_ID=MMETSP0323_2 /ASSEMBLY_ACC=CAM_ASM_000346 /LENGTH=69 /DNA_ID=CAMNT_0039719877 /DNA_START=96 /DNA_END=305 /DNA_ORIENTATION=+